MKKTENALAEPIQQVDRTYVLQRGRKLSYFGGCDYFRLSSHPKVTSAVARAIKEVGLNVAASRTTTGNHRLYGELENALAAFFGSEAAVLVGSGYAANIVAAQALSGQFERAVVDERSHGSVKDALPFLGCFTVAFGHRGVEHLAAKLRRNGSKPVVLLTDGMFSHDGSAAPLAEYRSLLPRGSWMIVDDAHGAGVLGTHGRGTVEHCGTGRMRLVQTISLSKAFGMYGGAVLCSRVVRAQIVARSRFFNGNTPLPLPLAAGALQSLELLRTNPDWRVRMHQNAAQVKAELRARGADLPEFPGPIVAVVPRGEQHAQSLSRRLLSKRVFPSLIRYAGGPPGGYFRFMISSEHSADQLSALCEGLTNAK